MYPSKYDLEAIESWSGTPRELIEFLDSKWEYNNNDWTIKTGRDGVRGTKVYRVYPSTWGWSGNEDMIGALQGTWFWMLFWKQSRRGGHYQFEITPYWIDRKSPHGFGNIITKAVNDRSESDVRANRLSKRKLAQTPNVKQGN